MNVPPEPSRAPASPGEQTSLLELAGIIVRRWPVVLGVPVAIAAVTAGISLIVPATYTAVTTFVPEQAPEGRLSSGLGSLAGLAGQFGVALGGSPTESPRFYATVAESRELLERVLLAHYADPRSTAAADSATLLRLLGVGGHDFADSLHRGVKKLSKRISVRADQYTNIVTVSVDSRYPKLAASVASNIVQYLNDFNTQQRQSQARHRREFVEGRVASTEQELHDAEDQLKTFYQHNRSWQQAPALVFEEGRLRRQLDVQQEVYLTLRREYETARIDEVNNTPVMTLIDAPVPPSEKAKPKRLLLTFMMWFLGGIGSVSWVLVSEFAKRMRRDRDVGYEAFSTALAQTKGDVIRLWHARGSKASRSSHRDLS